MPGLRPDEQPDVEARLMQTLYELSVSASRPLAPGELVKLVADHACGLVDADAAALYLWDDVAGLLMPAYSNDPRQGEQDRQPLRPGQGAAGQAILHRHTEVVSDYAHYPHATAWDVDGGLKSAQAVPLMVGDRRVGALVVRFHAPRQVRRPDDERMLMLLAAHVAPALAAASLYASSARDHQHERAVREITHALAVNRDERQVLDLAVRSSAGLLRAPYARVWLIQSNGELRCAAAEGFVHADTFKRQLPPESTSGLVARQQIVNLGNAPAEPSWHFNREFGERTGLGAYLGAGLWRAGQSLGVLEVMRQAGQRFGEVDEQLLLSLANAVAVAVSNARTHAAIERLAHEAEQRAAILEAVAFAAEKLLSAPEWEPSIDAVLGRLGAATEVSRVYIVSAGVSESKVNAPSQHEWTAAGVQPRLGAPHEKPYLEAVGLGRWEPILRKGGIIQGRLHSLPSTERAMLETYGVCSVVVVPIFAGPTWWGLIGFDDCRDERDWPVSAIEVLKTAAGTLGAAILRRRAEAERLQLVREQSARAEAEAAQRRLAFLAEASQVLAASLDYETTLQRVAELVVRSLANCCFVDIRAADGSIHRVASAAVEPLASNVADPIGVGIDPASDHPVAVCIRSGRPHLARQLSGRFKRRGGGAFQSGLVVPLVTRSGASGALTWLAAANRPAFGSQDLELAEDLARRCALAIDNSRLYREARVAVSIRDEFLSVAAHELKTPMTSLRGYAQLLGRELDKGVITHPERARRAAMTIQVQCDKLSRLVDQLLDITRIESGKLALDRHEADLSQLVRDVLEAARTRLKDHTLVASLPDELIVLIDPLRIEQVVTNLVDNAIKYSPEGDPIDVSLAQDAADGTIVLAVRDHGVGVPPEHRAHIFDRFYQAHAGGPLTSMAGMGLGLYISRQIVDLHAGSIAAVFPEDGGAQFVVSLPDSRRPAAELSADADRTRPAERRPSD